MKDILECKKCSLYLNQLPLLDKKTLAEVMWVGLSAKEVKNINTDIPLAADTNSGLIIKRIEEGLELEYNFYKTNLVKCLPLTTEGKLRYPSKSEMTCCFENLQNEISALQPKFVFLLGLKVANHILNHHGIKVSNLNQGFIYSIYEIDKVKYIPIHHPSYIYVYKKAYIDLYIGQIQKIIKT